MKAVMMLAATLVMVSGSIASAKVSPNAPIASQKLDPNIPENHVTDSNMEKPCPYMTGGRRDKVAMQTDGAAATATKATKSSQTVTQ